MKNKIFDFINLHSGEESKEKVLENIQSNISFRGSNLWILACAIVIASVGLNVNSTAVIIGAMLISPLMGPIVGAGFALAIYDFDLLKKSFKNLLIATIVSLIVAFVYFYISPFKEEQSELLARTSPTIYDILIAFFGGLVGVIAITRVEKGNPIPGVAIATALMPPLCTAGFGLAIGKISFFLGAFYLYTINCVFICIATFIIAKYLKYKPVKFLNIRYEKKIRYGITILILVMTLPSIYLAYNLLQEKRFNQKAEQFITQEFTNKGFTIIYKSIKYNSNPKQIELAFLTKRLSDEEQKKMNVRLNQYGLVNTKIIIKQSTKDIEREIMNDLGSKTKALSEKDILINNLQNELKIYKMDNPELMKELSILYPEMKDVSFGVHKVVEGIDSTKLETVMLYKTDIKSKSDTTKLRLWLQQKLQTKNIILVNQR